MENNQTKRTAYSVLDLATIIEGQGPEDAFLRSLDMARNTEKLGYLRYWLAEHHNIINVASSATSVLIGYIAAGTSTIRVGSGGIMLPNHPPLIVAEQFGTLSTLYPGRIDLGLGRAPGSDQITAMEIRGENYHKPHNFREDIEKLETFFSPENISGKVRAIPGEGLHIPIWILGSSTDSARLAGIMGLPYAFAAHFAPTHFLEAVKIYKENFHPSKYWGNPYIIGCVNVVAAETDQQAQKLATSLQRFLLGVVTGKRKLLPPPVDSMDDIWTNLEKETVNRMLGYSFVGSQKKIQSQLRLFLSNTGIDEIMAVSHIYKHMDKVRSYEIFANAMNAINETSRDDLQN